MAKKVKECVGKACAFYRKLHELAFGWSWKTGNRKKKVVVAFFRMLWITLKGFHEDLITMRAASLTYITLVSIVPTLVFSFAIAKGLGADEVLAGIIEAKIVDFPEGARVGIEKIITTVKSANYAAIGATGFVVVAFTVIKLLGNIEHSLNDIWGVKQHRTLLRKFSDYISTVVIMPILILASSTATVALSTKFVQTKIDQIPGVFAFFIETLISFSGIFVIIFAFFLLYIWMPNTRVKVVPALIGGAVGGISWKLMLLVFVSFQSSIADAGKVYGTFAALPLFLVWLYASWVVVLLGAEVAFSAQYWRTYDLNSKNQALNFSSALMLAMMIVKGVIGAFKEGKKWCPERFADRRLLSVKNVLEVTDLLEQKGLLERNNEPTLHFVPGRMLGNISVGDVVHAVAGDQFQYLESAEHLKTGLVEFAEDNWDQFVEGLKQTNVLDV